VGATSRRRWPAVVGAILAASVVVTVVVAVLVAREVGREIPTFASLAEHPDRSLQGPVAYVDFRTRCIHVVAAAGSPDKRLWCLPNMDVDKAVALGKEQGPQLVWLPDGRLEVTMFRMTDPPGPGFRAGWQKIVDVRTGAVEDVPDADAPSAPNLDTHPTVRPDGARITTSSDPGSGKVEITLTDADGTRRTLLSVHGPGGYGYWLNTAFWSPDGSWVAADDGRILVITVDDPSVTRVLVTATQGGAFGGDDPRLASFAVTEAALLTGSG
jgi:hypothetical protein